MSRNAAAGNITSPHSIHQRYHNQGIIAQTFIKGMNDYFLGLLCWRTWLLLTWYEIRSRYTRTIIGPFWTTISVAIFITAMGTIFSVLWHRSIHTYIPFFASGYICWTFLSTTILDSSKTYISATEFMYRVPVPYSVHSFKVIARNVVTMAHHMVVLVIIALIFKVSINFYTLLFFPGMLVLCITGSWVSILFGLLVTRFRDVEQIIASLLQVCLFLTPIFWQPSQLGTGRMAKLLLQCNPLLHFLDIVRQPLLGTSASLFDWEFSIIFCLLGWLGTMFVFGKYYKNLVFWL
jgi:ABC-type polysaccharide/polyol phosphate export permease